MNHIAAMPPSWPFFIGYSVVALFLVGLVLVSMAVCAFESLVAACTLGVWHLAQMVAVWVSAAGVATVLYCTQHFVAGALVTLLALLVLAINDSVIHGPIRHTCERASVLFRGKKTDKQDR